MSLEMARDVTQGAREGPRWPEMAGDCPRLPEVPSSRGVGVAEYEFSSSKYPAAATAPQHAAPLVSWSN